MKIIAVEPIGIDEQTKKLLEDKFQKIGYEFVVHSDRQEDETILIERLKDADIGIVSNIKLTKNVLSQCPKLKMLSIAFTGVDHIDLEFCKQQNICVCNASGYATTAVSELTVALILDVYRKISELDNKTRIGSTRENFVGRELSGKTVGIIGTGAIGTATAMLLQAFGCKIVAWSRTPKMELMDKGIIYLSLNELLKTSDIISLHLPLTDKTNGLISEEKLALCKSSAILINTARGKVVDMQALAQTLNDGKLAGAGIDIFEKEPPLEKTHPLLNAKNCIVTPHIAYATREAFDKRIEIVIKNIEDWLNEIPTNCVT